MQVKNTTQTHIKMINKLNKDDRLEYLIKYNKILLLDLNFQISFWGWAIITFILLTFGMIGLSFLTLFFALLSNFGGLLIYTIRNNRLISEYFEIKPRSKK